MTKRRTHFLFLRPAAHLAPVCHPGPIQLLPHRRAQRTIAEKNRAPGTTAQRAQNPGEEDGILLHAEASEKQKTQRAVRRGLRGSSGNSGDPIGDDLRIDAVGRIDQ